MHIEFEPGRMTLEEARGVVLLLLSVHGDSLIESVTSFQSTAGGGTQKTSLMTVEIDASKAVEALREEAVNIGVSLGAEPIVDIDPAEAFGAPQASEITPPSEPTAGTASAFDSAGVPWDERIHSSGRTLVKDGTWRRKAGISDDEFNRVMAELKGQPTSPPVVAPAAPVAPQPPSSTAPAAPTPPPAPPASPPAAPPTATGLPPFPAFMTRMAPLQKDGKITLARISEIAQSLGVPTLPDLAKPEFSALIPTIEDMVNSEAGAQ